MLSRGMRPLVTSCEFMSMTDNRTSRDAIRVARIVEAADRSSRSGITERVDDDTIERQAMSTRRRPADARSMLSHATTPMRPSRAVPA